MSLGAIVINIINKLTHMLLLLLLLPFLQDNARYFFSANKFIPEDKVLSPRAR